MSFQVEKDASHPFGDAPGDERAFYSGELSCWMVGAFGIIAN